MSLGKLLQPDLNLGDTILGLTPEIVQRYGLKGMILDVDETLVPPGITQPSPELLQWLAQIKPIALLWLVSNNPSKTRIEEVAEALALPYLFRASKPSRRKLRQALTAMGLPAAEVAMVGDRLFTDVLAGNRLGLFTILVQPMVSPQQVGSGYPFRNIEIWLSRQLGASLPITLDSNTDE